MRKFHGFLNTSVVGWNATTVFSVLAIWLKTARLATSILSLNKPLTKTLLPFEWNLISNTHVSNGIKYTNLFEKMEIVDEKFYKDLDPILDEVNKKFIQMDDVKKKTDVDLTLQVVEFVINKMKADDQVFKYLYSKLEYVGSYFDGLRVKEATEFDMNLIMKLPINYNNILVENTNVTAGHVKVNVSKAIDQNNQQSEMVKRTIQKWCDPNGYLLQNRVREWMEGVISRCLGTGTILINISSREFKLKIRKCGPAFTLMINGSIDVDLVFAIEFPATKKPPGPIRWSDELAAPWVVVPKPLENDCFWRVSFSNSERKLIHQKYKLKFINRLLKAFRDSQSNLEIPSYFIKTLFLWHIHNCNHYNINGFWEKRQGYLFIFMLKKLNQALDKKCLSYYWHKKMNLFHRIPLDHIVNMANQLKNIIKKIEDLIKAKEIAALKNFVLFLFTPKTAVSTKI